MRIKPVLVAAAMLLLWATGCTGPEQAGVATAGGSTPSNTATGASGNGSDADKAARFGKCMRANGVPSFPDPKPVDGGVALEAPAGVDPKVMDAAMAKCKQYLPGGGTASKIDPQRVEQLRKYAQCMRANGVPKFPDPGADGGIKLDGNDPAMRPDNPKFVAAQRACAQYQGPSGGPTGGVDTSGPQG